MNQSLLIALLASGAASFPTAVSGTSPATQFAVCGEGLSNFFGFQPWYACLPQDGQGNYVITSLSDVFLIIFPVVEWLVKASALIAAFIIFYLLIEIMRARGDTGKIATNALGIRDAIIGFIIALISIAIVNYIAGVFQP